MRCINLISAEAKRSAIAVALLVAVGQVLLVGSLFGGFSGTSIV